jgi:hypothetical protein
VWYRAEDVHQVEVGPKSTLRYHCERLPYVAYPQARVCRVGQIYTPGALVIDSDLNNTLGYE